MPISVLDSRPVQMNVRMDRQLKEAGDAVLAHIGMTPSQAVRELWQYLTENGHMPVAKRMMTKSCLTTYDRRRVRPASRKGLR